MSALTLCLQVYPRLPLPVACNVPAKLRSLVSNLMKLYSSFAVQPQPSGSGADIWLRHWMQEGTSTSLQALFSMPENKQRAQIGAMVRRYVTGPGRPSILDAVARTEEAFSFATAKRRAVQRAWYSTVDAI